jgi:hypothetical protein
MGRKEIGSKVVAESIRQTFLEYFKDVPEHLTADEAIQYALYTRALDGEVAAAKAVRKATNKEDKEDKTYKKSEKLKAMLEV